jgi:hypothetical protein
MHQVPAVTVCGGGQITAYRNSRGIRGRRFFRSRAEDGRF